MITRTGNSFRLGATLEEGGVNFCVFAPRATGVELLLFEHVKDKNPIIISLDSEENKSYSYWHVWVPKIGANQLYGYRVHGNYNPSAGDFFDASKVLVDPYTRAIVGEYDRDKAHKYGECNLSKCLKSAVIDDFNFDWENDAFPNHKLSDSILYELHVKGFTANHNSGVTPTLKGTYKGLVEKIPYLKNLGITAVELLPVFAFDPQDAPHNRINYWGYSPINFFAVHAPYAYANKPQEIVDEFKAMIKAFHKANIEVYLDVVYNHTTENDGFRGGPTLSMRGFSNHSYYMLDANGQFRNYTGTGNTFNANHSVARRMIRHSLRYWVRHMHVDGFRFDLASVLSRDENGFPLENPPILWSIDSDPILSQTKIIAEPWDAAGLHQVSDFTGDRWVVWNDMFRDDFRKFVKGDSGMVTHIASRIMGSPDDIRARNNIFSPEQSLNFITCHDGFTLKDLVSYNDKHNFSNGEKNRDGSNQNNSWNCGVEGATKSVDINQFRKKQIKNLVSLLLLSQGTPMLSMGDEIERSQMGNNNAYCQDNELAWMDWDLLDKNQDTYRFIRNLIRVLKQFKIFRFSSHFLREKNDKLPYIKFHGVEIGKPDYSFNSHSLACEIIAPNYNEHVFIIMNMFWEDLNFELPKGIEFKKIFDTEKGFDFTPVKNNFICPARCVAMFSEKSKMLKGSYAK